jgi:hypothetical protein
MKFDSPYESHKEFDLDHSFTSEEQEDPLSTWCINMSEVTSISAKYELASVYEKLITSLDDEQFNGKLASDTKLWLPDNYFPTESHKMLQVTKELFF